MIQAIQDQVNPNYSETYQYDEFYRLASAETSVWSLSWVYDRYGNRLSQSGSGGVPTETLTISTTTNRVSGWTYDAAGNVTNDGTHTYAYDAENRLISVDAGVTATYAYGPNGERVWKVAGGVTTYYYWGIGEKVSGSWTKFFVSGLGGKLVEYSSSTTKFFVTNHLGSVAARMDVSGTLSETYRYLPFGELFAGTATTHEFTGKERDQESGLDYFGARYLASCHGRWMSVDPLSGDNTDPRQLNRYAYVHNDPVNFIDPDGKGEITITIGVGWGAYEVTITVYHIARMFGIGGGGAGIGTESPPAAKGPLPRAMTGPLGTAVSRALGRLAWNDNCRDALGGQMTHATLKDLWNSGRIRNTRNPRELALLKEKNAAAAYIGEVDIEDLEYLENTALVNQSGGFYGGTYEDAEGTTRDLVRDTANLLKVDVGVGQGQLNLWNLQELIILHELGHATKFLANDGNDKTLNEKNTKDVWKACF